MTVANFLQGLSKKEEKEISFLSLSYFHDLSKLYKTRFLFMWKTRHAVSSSKFSIKPQEAIELHYGKLFVLYSDAIQIGFLLELPKNLKLQALPDCIICMAKLADPATMQNKSQLQIALPNLNVYIVDQQMQTVIGGNNDLLPLLFTRSKADN